MSAFLLNSTLNSLMGFSQVPLESDDFLKTFAKNNSSIRIFMLYFSTTSSMMGSPMNMRNALV